MRFSGQSEVRIDLAKLEELAASDRETVSVSPAWLAQAAAEIRAGREAEVKLGKVFAGQGKEL